MRGHPYTNHCPILRFPVPLHQNSRQYDFDSNQFTQYETFSPTTSTTFAGSSARSFTLYLSSIYYTHTTTMNAQYVSILSQFPLVERQYVDRNGQPQVFASRGFILGDGINTMYAEMQGDLARAAANIQYDQAVLHSALLQTTMRDYRDKDGNVRYSNEVRILKLA